MGEVPATPALHSFICSTLAMTWGLQTQSHWQWRIIPQPYRFPLPLPKLPWSFWGFFSPRAEWELPPPHRAGHGQLCWLHPRCSWHGAVSLPALCPALPRALLGVPLSCLPLPWLLPQAPSIRWVLGFRDLLLVTSLCFLAPRLPSSSSLESVCCAWEGGYSSLNSSRVFLPMPDG